MAQFWFDGALTPDGSKPSWVPTPPANVSVIAAGRVVRIEDKRTAGAFWGGDSPLLSGIDDFDLVLKYRAIAPAPLTADHATSTRFSVWGRRSDSNNGYRAAVGAGSSTYMQGTFRRRVSGVNTDVTSISAYPATSEILVWRFMRFQCVGNTQRVRFWDETEAEPTDWDINESFTNFSSGYISFDYVFASFTVTEIEYVAVGTGADSAPSTGRFSVSGTVASDAGVPVARDVRLIDRSSGKLIAATQSSAVDGSYEVQVNHSNEVQVVALDNTDGTVYNDLILRTTPV